MIFSNAIVVIAMRDFTVRYDAKVIFVLASADLAMTPTSRKKAAIMSSIDSQA